MSFNEKQYKKDYYIKHKREIDEGNRRWNLNHPGHKREASRINHEIWGYTDRSDFKKIKEAEVFVAESLLPRLGFSNILHCWPIWGNSFPFDIIAEYEGSLAGIDVALSFRKMIKPSHVEFMERFSVNGFLCHLRPDYSWFCLKKIEGRSSTCWGLFAERDIRTTDRAYNLATNGVIAYGSLD